MSDLIRREDALDELKYEMKYGAEIDRCGLDTAYDIIENVASAEPERKTGVWISVESNTVNGRCSVCGYESHLYENDVYGEHYCPNCGAKMENE